MDEEIDGWIIIWMGGEMGGWLDWLVDELLGGLVDRPSVTAW